MNKPLVIADAHVPGLEPLEQVATVVRMAPDAIDADAVRDADALVVRTRTRCDAALLAGSNVKFVGTATIGVDHIDREWCAAQGITVASAPGCNAPAVAQYVFASLLSVINRPLSSYTIGIVGVGNVGRIVERWARGLGMRVLLCDPPRARMEGPEGFVSLDEIARHSDIITFHTPLIADGPDRTVHLADGHFFNSLRRAPIIINAARGPVTDTVALIEALDRGVVSHAIIDCWEGEPRINPDLLSSAAVATPHIAGYSLNGKMRATVAVCDALCHALGLPRLEGLPAVDPVPDTVTVRGIISSYSPEDDTAALRARPADFETLRNNYALRPEVQPGIES